MKKSVIIILVVILLAAVAGLLGWYFTKEEPLSTTSTVTNTNTTATTNVEILKPPANTVWIMSGSFTPSVLTIEVGEKVTWVNKDDFIRRVASDPHPNSTDLPELVSNDLEKGESFSFSFTEEGEWSYHDYLNPIKHGKIIVE